MQINVNVQVGEGDDFTTDPNLAARLVLEALGGDTEKDSCHLSVTTLSPPGVAGVASTAPSPDSEGIGPPPEPEE